MALVHEEKLHALVVDCIIRRLNIRESLQYINHELQKDAKFFKNKGTTEIKAKTLQRVKKHLNETKYDKLYDIAREGFVNQHLERIENLELVLRELWICYRNEKDPSKAADILWYIVATQPYLGQYHETTKEVMKHLSEISKEDQDSNLPVGEIPDSKSSDKKEPDDKKEADKKKPLD